MTSNSIFHAFAYQIVTKLDIIIVIILVSVPNGTHDGRINREHVCVRVGERNEKEKKSCNKVKFKRSSTRLNG